MAVHDWHAHAQQVVRPSSGATPADGPTVLSLIRTPPPADAPRPLHPVPTHPGSVETDLATRLAGDLAVLTRVLLGLDVPAEPAPVVPALAHELAPEPEPAPELEPVLVAAPEPAVEQAAAPPPNRHVLDELSFLDL